MANARLGWFSPLGVAASSRASARRLAFGFTASAFRHAPLRSGRWASSFFRLPLRSCRSAGWPSGSLLPLFGTHRFGVALGGLVLPLGGLAFGLTASAFRHAPIRSGRWAVGLRAYCFGDCHLAGWPSGSLLPLFGTHRFGVAAGRVRSSAFRFGDCPRRVGLRAHCFRFSARTASEWPPGGLAFGLTASAFRHAPLRKLPSAG